MKERMKRNAIVPILYALLGMLHLGALPSEANDDIIQSHGISEAQLDSLADIMYQAVKDNLVAGASFIVVHKGEVVFREGVGYADIESKRPFTADELLPIASVSKPFMASVVMALVDQGELKLEDPVEKYLSLIHISEPTRPY